MIVGFGDLDPNELAPSRSDLRQATDELLAAIAQLNSDVAGADAGAVAGAAAVPFVTGSDVGFTGSAAVDPTLMDGWQRYAKEVLAWDSGPDALIHIVDRTWLTELVAYEKQFNSFLQQLQAAGVSTSVAAFTFSSHPSAITSGLNAAASAARGFSSTIGTVLLVGGITVVGLYVLTLFTASKTIRDTGIKLL
jgi:hypothetical protein